MAVQSITSTQKLRVALVIVSFLLVPVTVLAAHWSWTPALPDLLPIHWDAAGSPDGWIPIGPLFTLSLTMSAAASLLGVVAILVPRVDLAGGRGALALAGCFAGGFAGLWIAPTWGAYAGLDVGWVVLMFTGCVAFGAVPYLLMPTTTAEQTSNQRTPDTP